MHPVANSSFLLFLFFRFSGYLKCPKSSEKIILKISVTEPSGKVKREQEGHHQGPRRVPGAPPLGRARRPPGWPGCPPDSSLRLYLPLGSETPGRKPFFAKPSLFRHRRFKIGAAWRSYSGTLPEGETHSERPSITMDASRMCRGSPPWTMGP